MGETGPPSIHLRKWGMMLEEITQPALNLQVLFVVKCRKTCATQ